MWPREIWCRGFVETVEKNKALVWCLEVAFRVQFLVKRRQNKRKQRQEMDTIPSILHADWTFL